MRNKAEVLDRLIEIYSTLKKLKAPLLRHPENPLPRSTQLWIKELEIEQNTLNWVLGYVKTQP